MLEKRAVPVDIGAEEYFKGYEAPENEERDMTVELAEHLIKVKLESEEKIFKLKDQILKLHREIEEANSINRALNSKLGGSDADFPPRKLSFGLGESERPPVIENSESLETSVAEKWSLGNEDFANGNYSECLKHHTAAVKLLFSYVKEQKVAIDNLSTELLNVSTERDFLRAKCSRITDAIAELETQLEGKEEEARNQEEIDALKEEIDRLNATQAATEDMLKDKENDLLEVSEQLRNSGVEVDHLNAEFGKIIERCNILEREKVELQNSISDLKTQLEIEAEMKAEAENLVQELESELRNERSRNDDIAQEAFSFKLKLENEIDSLQDELNRAERKERDLRIALEENQEINEKSEDEKSILLQEIRTVTQAKKEIEEEMQRITQQYEARIQDLEFDISNKDAELQAIEENEAHVVEHHQNEVSLLTAEKAELMQELERISSELGNRDEMNAVIQQLQIKHDEVVKKLNARNDDLKDKMSYKDLELVGKEREISSLSTKLSNLQDELERNRNDVDEFRMKLTDRDVEISEMKNTISELKNDNAKLRKHAAMLASEKKKNELLHQRIVALMNSFSLEMEEMTLLVQKVEEKLERKTRELEVLEQEKSEIFNLLEQEREMGVDKDALLSEFEHEVAMKVEEIQRLQQELKLKDDLEIRFLSTREELGHFIGLVDELNLKMTSLEQSHKDQESMNSRNLSRFTNELHESLSLASSLASDVESLKQLVAEAHEKNKTMEGLMSTKERALKAELREKTHALNLALKNLKALTKKVDDLEAEKIKIVKDAQEFYNTNIVRSDELATEKRHLKLDDICSVGESKPSTADPSKEELKEMIKNFNEVEFEKRDLIHSSAQTDSLPGVKQELLPEDVKKDLEEALEMLARISLPDASTIVRTIQQPIKGNSSDIQRLKKENSALKKSMMDLEAEVRRLESSIVLRKELFEVTLGDSDSEEMSEYLEDSCDEMTDDEENGNQYTSMITEDENTGEKISRLEKEVEEERQEGIKQFNLRAKLERKYERLSYKYNTRTSFTNSPQSYRQEAPPVPEYDSNFVGEEISFPMQSETDDILRLKDSKIDELKDLLRKHQVDVDMLTKELSKFYYRETVQKKKHASSPTRRFFSVFRDQVAPNVLVILVAFFTALGSNDFDVNKS